MSEIAPAGGGPNRLFVVLAIGLAALLVLGLIGLGGFILIPRLLGLGAPPSPTIRVAITTPTRPVATPTLPPTATSVPTEAATPTLVLSAGAAQTVVATSAPVTPTVIGGGQVAGTATPTGTGQLPRSGLGEDLLLLTGGIVLVMVIFVARRVRTN